MERVIVSMFHVIQLWIQYVHKTQI